MYLAILQILVLDRPREAVRLAELKATAPAQAVVDGRARHRDYVLALPVLDEVEGLQRADDVLHFDRRHVTHHSDRQLALVVAQ